MKYMTIVRATSLSLASTLILVSPVFAENVRSTLRTKEQVRETIQEERQETRQTMTKKRSDVLNKHCQFLNEKFTEVEQKIQLRITTLNKLGKDTTKAQTYMATAKTQMAEAQSLCKQAVDKFDSVPSDAWSEQKTTVVEARSLAKKAHDAFIALRKTLVLAISSLNNAGGMMKGIEQ